MAGSTPMQFDVPEIHCQACADSIAAAVHRVDPAAKVSVDLATKRVVIGGKGETQDFMQAIEDAGYDVKAAV